jgi:hypothetical protein
MVFIRIITSEITVLNVATLMHLRQLWKYGRKRSKNPDSERLKLR